MLWATGRPAGVLEAAALSNAAFGAVAKWFKAEVCKTSIRWFESSRRLRGRPKYEQG